MKSFTKQPRIKKCGRPNWGTCANLLDGSRFTIKTSYTCASEKLIYVIICLSCRQNYIGENEYDIETEN